ncbi:MULTISPECIES: TetR family transcriptional regulator [unclassified Rhodococcus (in: high G+C Gram-positive bacteria)]|uniref:TetR/AcrR family transcriptional regulator n=1 Tax=Rhodococcus sp. SJ-3 TaxID=3454628 RepID=UPI003F79528A
MVGKTPSPQAERRSRPKNRRDQIATAAAIAFSERGYHGVSVEDIADEVGITKSALYRHFPGKYALFLNSALILLDALESALESSPTGHAESATDELRAHLCAIIGTTIANRRTAGIYRWERRYLRPEDRSPIRRRAWEVNRRIGECVSLIRPDISSTDTFVLVAAMLSAIGSITAHSLTLAPRRIEHILVDACVALSRSDLSSEEPISSIPTAARHPSSVNNMREDLLQSAIELFHREGYAEIGVEEIASTVGLPASGVYRYFPSKADILAAAFYRAIDRLETSIESALQRTSSPRDGLEALATVYIELCISQRELMSVYFAELINVPPGPRADLRMRQRLDVEQWATLLNEVRPELSSVESRFLLYAALNLVPDLGVFLGPNAVRQQAPRIHAVMMSVLLGSTPEQPASSEHNPRMPKSSAAGSLSAHTPSR